MLCVVFLFRCSLWVVLPGRPERSLSLYSYQCNGSRDLAGVNGHLPVTSRRSSFTSALCPSLLFSTAKITRPRFPSPLPCPPHFPQSLRSKTQKPLFHPSLVPWPCTVQVYPRPNGEMYLCGLGGSDYVDPPRLKAGGDCDKPEVIQPDPSRVTAATNSFKGMTSIGNEGPTVTQVRWARC